MHLTDDVLADLLEAVKGKGGLEALRVNPQSAPSSRSQVTAYFSGAP